MAIHRRYVCNEGKAPGKCAGAVGASPVRAYAPYHNILGGSQDGKESRRIY